ncbi:MAG: glycosyltransferase [Candidatus Omnitrophica bacterium]|nr:glycosyltransferase [Candidatus Omnitrophota bacterium]
MTPLISVLMTAYNREKYIAEAIESVLASTYTNWELIVVDDCSEDRTVEIARSYEAKDPRIKVYVNAKNLGDYPNRNRAAAYAKGKYLKYLDADDKIYPHGLEEMVKTMESFPEAGLGVSQRTADDLIKFPYILSPREVYELEYFKRGVICLGPTGTIIRSDIFRKLGGFSVQRYLGDREMWLRIAREYAIVKITPDLVFWREHEGQEYVAGMESGAYLEEGYALEVGMLRDPLCPLDCVQVKKALAGRKWRYGRDIVRMAFSKGQLLKAYEMYSKSDLGLTDMIKGICFKKDLYSV